DRVQIELPEREPYQATPRQAARYQRVLAELERRKVPTLSGRLFINDDEETTLRESADVAKRALVLTAVGYLADGGDRKEALEIIEQHQLWPAVSPIERRFLEAETTDPDQARKLLWRLEGLWVLVWALGGLELGWPAGFCDVPRLMQTIRGY